ncbi:MAG: hypothetical protein R6V85_05775 [Polyangia bacterium]
MITLPPMRLYPSKEQIKQSWEKYGLIVVGNIIFFTLLYFISYRPHNAENRAAEFLSLAQQAETEGRHDAALVVYRKIGHDYDGTEAADFAAERIPLVEKKLARPPRKEPEQIEPVLDLDEMLDREPSVYVATYLAEHYRDDPANQDKILRAIESYLHIANTSQGIGLRELAGEKEFQSELFQRKLFTVQPRCRMRADWLWDDFSVKNTNFFAWHNVNVELTVRQGDEKETARKRVKELEAGQSIEMLEMWIDSGGGVVTCEGKITAAEGTATWSEQI